MTANFPDDGMCYETSVSFFNHKCDRFSIAKCMNCLKPLCEDHGHMVPEGTMCTTCLKRKAQADQRGNLNDDPSTRTSQHEHYYHETYYHDPYFYGTRYYPDYGTTSSSRHQSSSHSSSSSPDVSGGDFSDNTGHDPMDFTEGDAGSLRREDDASFETDMGAS